MFKITENLDCYQALAWWQYDSQWGLRHGLLGWHHAFVIGWSKYRLGLPSAPLHYGLTWPVGIRTVCPPTQWQSRSTVLTTGKCLLWGLCQGTVKESSEKLMLYIEGILPRGPYRPCVSMAGRALLAGYHRYVDHENFRIWIGWYSSKPFKSCRHSKFDPLVLKLEFSEKDSSIPWLLMPRLLVSPGHQ